MGLVFNVLVYVSGYLSLMFVAICLACGLYYLAELAEEYTVLTRRLMKLSITAVLVVHVLMLVLEQLPYAALAVGFATHLCYAWLMLDFPFIRVLSPAFLVSFAMLVASHYLWASHFLAHFHKTAPVVCFFIFNVWLVPFGFFVSLSVNESTLPDRQASAAEDVYSEGGRTKQRSGILSMFSFFQHKRDDMVPAMGKRV